MKFVKRCFALALALTLSLLAGCAGSDPIPGASEYQTEDVVSVVTDGALTRDTALVTVNGDPIPAEELLYWAIYDCDYMAAYFYGGPDNIDWTDTYDENTPLDQYVLSDALHTAKLYRLLQSSAAKDGITLSEEQKEQLMEEHVDSLVTSLGSKEEFTRWLSLLGISYEGYYNLNQVQYLFNNYLATFSAEDIAQYVSENQLYHTKHILISTVDENNEPVSEDEKAAALEKAQGLLQQLRDSEDPLTLFDTLMNEHSEDGGLASSPDGYLASTDPLSGLITMVEPYETAALALAENEISDIVESSFGYHIILRLNPDTKDARTLYFEEILNAWMDSAEVVETEAYTSFDLESFYDGLTAYRNILDAAEETPSGTASPQPTETPAE